MCNRRHNIVLAILFLLCIFGFSAPAWAQEECSVEHSCQYLPNGTTASVIPAFNGQSYSPDCERVTDNCGADIMVPFATEDEWNGPYGFVGKHESCATLAPCNPDYVVSYSVCSASCGGGTETPSYSCQLNGATVSNTICANAGLPTPGPVSCNIQSCAVSCTATVPGGYESTTVPAGGMTITGYALVGGGGGGGGGGEYIPGAGGGCIFNCYDAYDWTGAPGGNGGSTGFVVSGSVSYSASAAGGGSGGGGSDGNNGTAGSNGQTVNSPGGFSLEVPAGSTVTAILGGGGGGGGAAFDIRPGAGGGGAGVQGPGSAGFSGMNGSYWISAGGGGGNGTTGGAGTTDDEYMAISNIVEFFEGYGGGGGGGYGGGGGGAGAGSDGYEGDGFGGAGGNSVFAGQAGTGYSGNGFTLYGGAGGGTGSGAGGAAGYGFSNNGSINWDYEHGSGSGGFGGSASITYAASSCFLQ